MTTTERPGTGQSFGQSQGRDFPYFRRLWNSVVVALIAASFTPLIVIGGGMYYYTLSLLEKKTLDSLTEEINEHREAIDEFLEGKTTELKLLSSNLDFDYLASPDGIRRVFESLQRELSGFIDLGVIDDEGRHLAYVGPYDLLSRNYQEAPWFRIMKDRDVYVSDVFSGFRKVPHFIIAVKHKREQGYWILRATVDTEYFDRMVEGVLSRRPGDAFIVNQSGTFQTQPRAAGELMGQWDFKPIERFDGVRRVEEKGQITLMTWLENAPWICVVKLDRETIYRDLREVRIAAVVIFVLGGILILGTVLLTTNYLFARLETKRRNIRFLDDQLRHSSRMASTMRLAAGLIRDVNDSLSNIDMVADWMRELTHKDLSREENRKEIAESLQQIKAEISRTRESTEKVLKATRPTMPLIQEVRINDLLDEILDLLDRELRFARITVRKDYLEGLPSIQSDPSQLRQVFQNLMLNAIAAIQTDGEVTLGTRQDRDGIKVFVEDNGPGISPDAVAKIFDPLFTAKPDGTGIGLSISARILEKLGGRISVESQAARGARFTVDLPYRFKTPGP